MSPAPKTRQALLILERLGSDARLAVPVLIRGLQDPNCSWQYDAIQILGCVGSDAAAAVPALAESLAIPGLADHVLNVLSILSSEAAPAEPHIRQLMLRGDAELLTLLHAATVYHSLVGADATLPVLMSMLRSDAPNSRIAAGRTLQDLARGPPNLVAELVWATRSPPGAMKATGADILASLKPPAIPALIELAQDPDPDVQRSAIMQLGRLRATDALPQLRAALSVPDRFTRSAAADALSWLGAAAADALPDLTARLADPDEGVRKAAQAAIQAIRPP